MNGGIIAEHYIATSEILRGSFKACGLEDIALAEFAHVVYTDERMNRGASDDLHITAANFVGQRTVELLDHFSGPRGVGMFAAELESGVISADGGEVEVELANGEHG